MLDWKIGFQSRHNLEIWFWIFRKDSFDKCHEFYRRCLGTNLHKSCILDQSYNLKNSKSSNIYVKSLYKQNFPAHTYTIHKYIDNAFLPDRRVLSLKIGLGATNRPFTTLENGTYTDKLYLDWTSGHHSLKYRTNIILHFTRKNQIRGE